MKLKIVTVDLELTRRQKRIGMLAGAIVVAALGASVAVATVPHEFTTGQTLKASDLNENFTDLDARIADLQGQTADLDGKTHAPSAFRARLTTATTANAQIVYNALDFDVASEFDTATGTFSPDAAGLYHVACGYHVQPVSGNVYGVVIRKNGATNIAASDHAPTSTTHVDVTTSGLVKLAAGDTLKCHANTSAVPAPSISLAYPETNFFSAYRVN